MVFDVRRSGIRSSEVELVDGFHEQGLAREEDLESSFVI